MARAGSARGDLRLQAKDVAVLYLGFGEGLRVLNLAAGIFVVEFIAERRAVGAVGGETQLLNQDGDDFVAGRIVGELHGDTLVFRGVVDGDVDRGHEPVSPRTKIISGLSFVRRKGSRRAICGRRWKSPR